MEEEKSSKAVKFIRENKNSLFDKFANVDIYLPDENPVTVFMAGSPGAGKTEFSRQLVNTFSNKAVRIDGDEIRGLIPDYGGSNSGLFQNAISVGVEELYHYCLRKKFNIVLDGTFAHEKTFGNIKHSIDKGRKVVIYFIYQEPSIAWDFTKKREVIEHRKINKDVFINSFIGSQNNARNAKKNFVNDVELNLVIKNLNNDDVSKLFLNIDSATFDSYLGRIYTKDELEKIII